MKKRIAKPFTFTVVRKRRNDKVALPLPVTNGEKVSPVARCRQMLAETPTISKDDLVAALAKEGHRLAPGSAATLKADFAGACRALQWAGFATPLD